MRPASRLLAVSLAVVAVGAAAIVRRRRPRRPAGRSDPRRRLRSGLAAGDDAGPRPEADVASGRYAKGYTCNARRSAHRYRWGATASSGTSTPPVTSAPSVTDAAVPIEPAGPARAARRLRLDMPDPTKPVRTERPAHPALELAARVVAAQHQARAARGVHRLPDRPARLRRRLRRQQGLPHPSCVEPADGDPRSRGRLLPRRDDLLGRLAVRPHPRRPSTSATPCCRSRSSSPTTTSRTASRSATTARRCTWPRRLATTAASPA